LGRLFTTNPRRHALAHDILCVPCPSVRQHRRTALIVWDRLIGRFTDLFTRPSSALFLTLVTGWVLCPGRRTITRMVDVADPDGVHAHDAYHRFLREGRWEMAQLWRRLAALLVGHLEGNLRLVVDLDDTLFHRVGRGLPRCRRAGGAPPRAVVAEDFRRYRTGLAHRENPRGAHRRHR
jgi:hypothetical protein